MKMKTYREKTFKGAIDRVKSDFGAEAFVLSSHQVRAPGLSGILGRKMFEITAGVEGADESPDLSHARNASPQRTETMPLNRAAAAREYTTPNPPAPPARDSRERQELMELRRWIYSLTRLSLPPNVFILGEPLGEIFDELCANDVDPTIAKTLVNTAYTHYAGAGKERLQEIRSYVGSLIEKMVSVKTTNKRIKIFIGPTGVGKTTTIAKLGARALVNREGKVGLITLDTFRIGGIQQLRTYSEIMSAPMKVARNPDELERILQEWRNFDVLLIDTVGKNQRHLEELTSLAEFLHNRKDIEKHLILSATTKALDLREIIEKFDIFSPDFLCFTKLDETTTFGCILNEQHRIARPLSYFGIGQRVPEDLEVAAKERVSELVIGGGN